mgnify:CR=1 FL=1
MKRQKEVYCVLVKGEVDADEGEVVHTSGAYGVVSSHDGAVLDDLSHQASIAFAADRVSVWS